MTARYDTIGRGYAALRRPDPRIAAAIHAALGGAVSVLNVGAGAGSYEPGDREVTALEPSAEMIAQRPPGAAPCVQGRAEALPFGDGAFDAAMAVLTVHHWQDQRRGLAEIRRVARGPVVILTYDPAFTDFWLYDYFPGLPALDARQMPPLATFAEALGPVEIAPVPVPHDCTDGFLAAYWARPELYLEPARRAAMSSFHALGGRVGRAGAACRRSRKRRLGGALGASARRARARSGLPPRRLPRALTSRRRAVQSSPQDHKGSTPDARTAPIADDDRRARLDRLQRPSQHGLLQRALRSRCR